MGLESFIPRRFRKEPPPSYDPTKASVVLRSGESINISGRVRESGREVGRDRYGRFFYSINQNPRNQMFMSLVLKGVMPVCDVVYDKKSGQFFSYEIPIQRIERADLRDFRGRFEADKLILKFVFNDIDHSAHNFSKHIDSEGGAHVFYDFGIANFWDKFQLDQEGHYDDSNLKYLSQGRPEGTLKLLFERLSAFKEHFSGEVGRRLLQKAAERVYEVPPDGWSYRFDLFSDGDSVHSQSPSDAQIYDMSVKFQKELLRRVDVFQDILRKFEGLKPREGVAADKLQE